MKTILMTAMEASISEVMETMFFLPVEFGREATLAQCKMDKKNNLVCRLVFTGDASGSLILMAPEILAAEMAENFMGEVSENLTQDHLSGTLTEMLNMVCGNALSKTKSKVPFELGIPEMMDPSEISEKQVFTIVETTESKMAITIIMD
ncbi:chemotaxis protein CheX [Desulfobacula sp.]|uniref:chemotaxis protein CheX n=1 Tax=Desulfobacula sp. TaxID=2593537 RepID=UPI002625B87B|nr:chemotaxis protein CheX [Desulfobacula sp.]